MTRLLDGNLLAAYAVDGHPDHDRVCRWFQSLRERFATCSVTQGTLLRLHMRLALDSSAAAAWRSLQKIMAHPRHEFWDDGFSYEHVSTYKLQGHRQVTDFWLAELARRNGGKLATMDTGLEADQADAIELIP